MRGNGNKGANGGPAGDLIIAVRVRPHPFFERDGYNVWCEVHVTYAQAALGDTLYVPTLDGKVKFDLSAGTQPGDVVRFKGRGIQALQGRGRGDQFVKIIVDVPKNLTGKQKDLLKQFDATLTDKPKNNVPDGNVVGEEKKGFWDKFKN
ncbi:MAG: molecular chaperone DnaJ, partial [Clostridia bacterium]|nr:molecular chaperone DnaJ [Clostridia bacterium]